jgi:hypothetical protein
MENVTSSKLGEYACAKWYYIKRYFSQTNKQGVGIWWAHEQNEGIVPIKALSFSWTSPFNGYDAAIQQFWWIVIHLLGNTH